MAYNNYINPYSYNSMYNNPQMPINMNMPNINNGMAQQPVIKGRYASSLDEVRAAQIDFDGSKTYFVCPAINTIYAKSIDMNGNSLIKSESHTRDFSHELDEQIVSICRNTYVDAD